MAEISAAGAPGNDEGSLLDRLLGAGRTRGIRLAVAAAWLVLSAASVAFALTGGEHNPIDAKVLLVNTGIGQALSIQNRSDEPWTGVTVTLPGDWAHRAGAVRSGERLTLEVWSFERVDSEGAAEKPPRDFVPDAVTVRTDQGTYATRLQGKR